MELLEVEALERVPLLNTTPPMELFVVVVLDNRPVLLTSNAREAPLNN